MPKTWKYKIVNVEKDSKKLFEDYAKFWRENPDLFKQIDLTTEWSKLDMKFKGPFLFDGNETSLTDKFASGFGFADFPEDLKFGVRAIWKSAMMAETKKSNKDDVVSWVQQMAG